MLANMPFADLLVSGRKSDFGDENPTRITLTNGASETGGLNELESKVIALKIKSGIESGRLLILTPGEWLAGRSNSSNIILRDSNCSRQHAKIVVSGQGRSFVNDLDSTNGILVNGLKIEALTEIKPGDELRFSDKYVFQVERLPQNEAQKQVDLYNQATHDGLTGAFNRKFFEGCVKTLLKDPSREPYAGLIIFDADHFKKVNDTYGHPGGDAVLRAISERAQASLRAEDIFARIGGEEFIIFAQIDAQQTLQMLSERLRIAMNAQPVNFQNHEISFSISLGTLFFRTSAVKDFESLYKIVDAALYNSKQSGRNRATHTTL